MLADFGVTLPKDTEIRVWDSTAETRSVVLPMRPAGALKAGRTERLADLVTRNSMIGTGLALNLGGSPDGQRPRHGQDGRFGKVSRTRANRPFTPNGKVACSRWHAQWDTLARLTPIIFGLHKERLPPTIYLTSSYYQRWQLGMETDLLERGYVTAEELTAGDALPPEKPLERKLTGRNGRGRAGTAVVPSATAGTAALQAG